MIGGKQKPLKKPKTNEKVVLDEDKEFGEKMKAQKAAAEAMRKELRTCLVLWLCICEIILLLMIVSVFLVRIVEKKKK